MGQRMSKIFGIPDNPMRHAVNMRETGEFGEGASMMSEPAVIAVETKPVAWLKTWTTGSDHCQRVDLHPRVEPWLAECNPTITPLFASPQPLLDAPRVKALEAALRPFAEIAPLIPGGMHDHTKVKVTAREPLGRSDNTLVLVTDGLTVGDFHAALSALQSDGEGE